MCPFGVIIPWEVVSGFHLHWETACKTSIQKHLCIQSKRIALYAEWHYNVRSHVMAFCLLYTIIDTCDFDVRQTLTTCCRDNIDRWGLDSYKISRAAIRWWDYYSKLDGGLWLTEGPKRFSEYGTLVFHPLNTALYVMVHSVLTVVWNVSLNIYIWMDILVCLVISNRLL